MSGLLILLSGPAGSGKSSMLDHVFNGPYSSSFTFSISYTTRAPRPGEINGVHYNFITEEEFQKYVDSNSFIEYTEYCGARYGTLRKDVEVLIESGKHVILELEVNGVKNIKEKFPDAVSIMILPPSFTTQEQRLRDRGTETEDKIQMRLERTKDDLANISKFDYVLYNYNSDQCAEHFIYIVVAENSKVSRDPNIARRYFSL